MKPNCMNKLFYFSWYYWRLNFRMFIWGISCQETNSIKMKDVFPNIDLFTNTFIIPHKYFGRESIFCPPAAKRTDHRLHSP